MSLLDWGLIFGGAYTWRGLFTEFYVNARRYSSNVDNERPEASTTKRTTTTLRTEENFTSCRRRRPISSTMLKVPIFSGVKC